MHRSILIFDRITSTTTSTVINVEGALLKSIWATANVTDDPVIIRAQVSSDGSNFVTYNKLISNVTNANNLNLTRVTNLVITANDSPDFAAFSPEDIFRYVRFIGGSTSTITMYLEVEEQNR